MLEQNRNRDNGGLFLTHLHTLTLKIYSTTSTGKDPILALEHCAELINSLTYSTNKTCIFLSVALRSICSNISNMGSNNIPHLIYAYTAKRHVTIYLYTISYLKVNFRKEKYVCILLTISSNL